MTRLYLASLAGCLALLCALPLPGQTQPQDTIGVITRNLLDQAARRADPARVKAEALRWSERLSTDGSWSDLDYDTRSRGSWDPARHLQRTVVMARACMPDVGSAPQLSANVEKAVGFWINRKPEPRSDNWWFETIGIPQDAGSILLFMQQSPTPLSDAGVNGLLRWMKKGRTIESQASTELVRILNIGRHYILRGCVTGDESLIRLAAEHVDRMLQPEAGYSGIQADYSYHSHGKQLYSHGYGVVMLGQFAEFARILKGTRFELSGNNARTLFQFAHRNVFNLARGQYLDYNVAGRGIARQDNLRAARLIPTLEAYRNLDAPAYAPLYEAVKARFSGEQPADYQVAPAHLHLWRSDYSAHIRPEYFVSLRLISTRMVKPERGNGENIQEHFRGNGAMSIMVSGQEYFNIFPVWKWNHIPGTTVPALPDLSGQPDWFSNFGKTDFVGGVSDGKYGVTVYDMDDYRTQARKSWFFFDRQVVCLGAGIRSESAHPVHTTLNQCFSGGAVTVKTPEGIYTRETDGAWREARALAILQGQVGYSFPGGQAVHVSQSIHRGSWRQINANASPDPVEGSVFTAFIDHGIRPVADAYAYMVWPGITDLGQVDPDAMEILANTRDIQAVQEKQSGICQAVFYKPGSVETRHGLLTVDRPCLILMRHSENQKPAIFVADPTQRLPEIKITLSRHPQPPLGWSVKLPQGALAGDSVSVNPHSLP